MSSRAYLVRATHRFMDGLAPGAARSPAEAVSLGLRVLPQWCNLVDEERRRAMGAGEVVPESEPLEVWSAPLDRADRPGSR